jgi:multicomponent K+:H+ antiporter subunit G
MSEDPLSLLAALLSLLGAFFFVSAAVGLCRLPDFYSRIHAPTKAATLGLMLLACGSASVHAARGEALWLEDLLLVLFVLLTVPVSSQMLIRGAAARRLPQCRDARGEAPTEPIERVDPESDQASG